MGTAGQNIGLELPKVCRRRDEAPNREGLNPSRSGAPRRRLMRSTPENR
jgi:hypothetical protein